MPPGDLNLSLDLNLMSEAAPGDLNSGFDLKLRSEAPLATLIKASALY